MSDAVLLAGGGLLILAQFAGPFLLARLLKDWRVSAGQLLAMGLVPGALLGGVLGFREHDLFPNLFAGAVMGLAPALLAVVCLRWSRSKPNGARAFYTLLWWSLACAWIFGVGGFIMMGLLASAFGNTGSDGVLGTAIKIGALGGGLCGVTLGGPVGLIRMLMLAKEANHPSSAVPEPTSPVSA
jgi:hypothetical protein